MARVVLGILLIGVFGGASPTRAEPPDSRLTASEAAARARAAFDAGKHDRAIELLELAYRKAPKPVYVYNMGRVLDAAGRYGDAHAKFLLVLAQPDTPANLRRLCEAQVSRLEPRRSKASLRIRRAEGEVVQLDGALIADPTRERSLSPGQHTLCTLTAGGDGLACWRRSLIVGRATTWPPPVTPGERGEVDVSAVAPLQALTIDGMVVQLPLSKVRLVSLDIGPHALVLEPAAGKPRRIDTALKPGRIVIEPLSSTPPHVGIGATGTSTSVDRGAGPWVLAGVGGAALASGVAVLVAGVLESADIESSERQRRDDGAIEGITQAEARSGRDHASTLVLSGVITAAIGAAALAGGLTWGLWPTEASGAGAARLDIRPTPTGASVRLTF